MWLIWLFLALPIIEIALFIQIGGLIGLWPTLGLVLLAGILGVAVIRGQGAMTAHQIQRSMDELRDPSRPLANGALVMLAGLLLILPGFFTDALALLLLLPPVRALIMHRIARRVRNGNVHVERHIYRREPYRPPFEDGVIDADYTVEDDAPRDPTTPPDAPRRGGSGWTRH